MKKKVLLVLSLFMLAACDNNSASNATPSVNGSATAPGASVVESPKTHAVVLPTNVVGAHVTASTLVQEENESVVVTVAMTRDDYELVEVKLGETKLNGVADEHNDRVTNFTFQMGKEDAVITVTTREVVPPSKDHTISFKDNDLAFVMGLPTEANVGDVVEFKVAVQSGYELTSVAAKAGEDNVEVTGDPVTGYQFEMPDSDVVVDATVLGAYFKVEVGDAVVAEGKSTQEFEMVKQLITKETEFNVSEGARSVFLRAGEKVTLRANRNGDVTADNYFVDGVALAQKAESQYLDYEFTMPAHNANITVEGKVREVPVILEKGEHTTAKIYRMVDGAKEEVTSAKVGEKLYVEATSSDKSNFPIFKISGAYKTYSSTGSNTELEEYKMSETAWGVEPSGYAAFTFESENVMSFTVLSRAYAGALTIKLAEKNLARYNAIKGTWTSVTFDQRATYSTRGKINGTDASKDWTIDQNGAAVLDGRDFTLDESGFTSNCAPFKNSSGSVRKLYFNINIAWAYDGFEIMSSGAHRDVTTTSIILYARDIEFANISYEQYGYNRSNEQSLVILKNKTTNAEIGNFFIDNAGKGDKGTIYMNVDVEMLKGTSISETGAAFTVSKDGKVLATIVGAEKGTYTNAESGELVLDGLGNATLNGVAGTYATVEGKMELTVGEKTYIVTLSGQTYTMTEKQAEEPTPEVPEYCGTWSGKTDSNADVTITINSDNTLVYSMYPNKTLNYTVDDSLSWKIEITVSSGIYSSYMLVINYNPNTKAMSYELIDADDLYGDPVETGDLTKVVA